MPFRSHRLEALLGARFEGLTYEHFVALEGNQTTIESDDVDWKVKYSGDSSEINFERAKDVAALANKTGGLLVLGVAQDKATSQISKVIDHPITDLFEREFRQSIAANVFPMPDYDIRRLAKPGGDGTEGVFLIGVPASPRRPHAVMSDRRPEYAYPRRTGNKIDWLTEPEIATMYRQRFAEAGAREQRIDDIEFDNVAFFEASGQAGPILVVSLVPEVGGEFKINRASLDFFRESMSPYPPIGENVQRTMSRVTVASARLQRSDARPSPMIHCEFHADGSGTWGVVPRVHAFDNGDRGVAYAQINYLVVQVLNALLVLSQHATENAGATGTALLRVAVWASVFDHDKIFRPVDAAPDYEHLSLGEFESGGGRHFRVDSDHRTHFAEGNVVCVLDSVNREGVGLTQTAALVASSMLQTFGLIETPQIAEDGTLYTYEFHHEDEQWWIAWCNTHGVPYRRSGR